MLLIETQARHWRDVLPGVKVELRRCEPADRAAAVRAAGRAREAASGKGLDDAELSDIAHAAFAVALAQRCILDWTGVLDVETKEPLPVTVETVQAFMTMGPAFNAIDRWLVAPQLNWSAEKNASGGSSDGTSAAPTPAKATASTARPGARNARTGSTTRKATKARRSGK